MIFLDKKFINNHKNRYKNQYNNLKYKNLIICNFFKKIVNGGNN